MMIAAEELIVVVIVIGLTKMTWMLKRSDAMLDRPSGRNDDVVFVSTLDHSIFVVSDD
jgi:hypothetical protein